MPRYAWVLLLFPLFLLFYDLSALGLFNNVEGMCAEIAREMRAGGHWIIPYLNDVPYIEKPPLTYWLVALAMSWFGSNDWAVRIVPATTGVLMLGSAAWFGWRMKGPRYALLAAFLIGTNAGFVIMWRDMRPDALLATFLNAAWLLTYASFVLQRKAPLRLAAVCLALAIMSKGLVALVLYGLVIVVYLLWSRRYTWRETLRMFTDPWALAVFLIVVVPWHVMAARELSEFAWFYFINEHLYRFLGIREPRDYYSGSVFYYLPRLALMLLPWLPLLALPRFIDKNIRATDRDLSRFLWCCALVPLVFFSVSSAKANYYAVVCVPALALIVALTLEQWLSQRERAWLWPAFFVVAIALIPTEIAVLRYGQRIEPSFSARPLAMEILKRERLPVFIYQDYEELSPLPFYLQSTVYIVDARSQDLLFGQKLGYGRAHFVSVEDFMARREPAWLVVLDPRQRELVHTPLPARLEAVAKVGRVTLYRWPGAGALGAMR